jgi:folate-dependent phosphoribosylglycinamide formyltransferase PurN
MNKPLINCLNRKLRVAGLISGSGKSLISILERQKEREADSNCNFEVVGVFSDNPNSKARKISETYNIPVFINDIKAFYSARNQKITDKTVRKEFDRQTAGFLKTLNPDIIIYAGYMWATTEPMLTSFQSINCHPADLSVENQGGRAYAGAHGVRDALLAGETTLNSTLHMVTAKIDHGPILLISEPVIVEKDSQELDLQSRSIKYLRLLNERSRKLCALGIEKISNNAFTFDSQGQLFYEGEPIPKGYRL